MASLSNHDLERLCQELAPELLPQVRKALFSAKLAGHNPQQAIEAALARLDISLQRRVDQAAIDSLAARYRQGGRSGQDAALALLMLRWCEVHMTP